MDRETIIERLNMIDRQNDIKRYTEELERLNENIKYEKLVEWNQTDREIRVSIIISKSKDELINAREFVFYFGDFKSIYFGTVPEVIRFYLEGDIENPGYVDDFLFTEILFEFDYETILDELNVDYKDLFIYYSPEYHILGIRYIFEELDNIVYYDLQEEKAIQFKEKTHWLKAHMEVEEK